MGKTQSHRIRSGLYLFKFPNSPNWYARCCMLINGQYVHCRSMRTTDIKEATRKAEEFRADCVLYARGDEPMPKRLVNRIDPAKRFDRVIDDWLDELEADAGKDARKLRNFRDKKRLCFAPNGIATFFSKADISKIDPRRQRQRGRFGYGVCHVDLRCRVGSTAVGRIREGTTGRFHWCMNVRTALNGYYGHATHSSITPRINKRGGCL